ncbi:hypothetical protein AMTRI_Chr08g160520 [Amborella trichopoda]|uniref:RING-CH-type domain-containing protein n=1 Tax=Amborella trichopoda TaxID=13333 RepID=W1PNG7_AMBTC|nr:uncharacterized protein LOC18437770 [Amborella trichopoda]ERN09613.1 hypothetical protein AMTR_s00029p00182780 [Amborella trichopoda]|eukprot:XP_006848032.1 uncharacterized protein LOC18437770 [Amborella trichopoda]
MGGGDKSQKDIEEGSHEEDDCSDSSFSDAEDRSWHSSYGSHGSCSFEEYSYSNASDPEIGMAGDNQRNSVSECSDVDLGNGVERESVPEIKIHLAKVERDCRICHLTLEPSTSNQESGVPIELGCSCKDDLAAAHKQCAEAWFKIKGNKTCEICGSTARNVVGVEDAEFMEQWNESNAVTTPTQEPRSFWRGHRFLNFLLACMVFAFVISWLFHFNVPS